MNIFNIIASSRVQILFAWLWVCGSFLLWNYLTVGRLSQNSIFFLTSLLLSSLLAGDIFVNWFLQDLSKFSNSITKTLLGFVCVNFLMLVLSFLSPFGLTIDWCALLLGVGGLWVRTGWHRRGKILLVKENAETIFLIISSASITAWTQDLLRPIEIIDGVGVIRAWPDIYYHLSQIRVFATSAGVSSISDVIAAGTPAHIYHIASYLLPATLTSFTKVTTLEAYSSLYLPMGVLLTAMSAYALINTIFGKWPALFSSIGLLVLPDAFQQGFDNPFLSYHWMQQIGPAGLYGVAGAAIAFMFLFQSCRTNSIKFLFLAYIFSCVTLLYKAQIFVAISFPMLIFPALFFENITKTRRIGAALVLATLYFYIVNLSQSLTTIPTLRLDGSSFSEYVSIIFGLQLNGLVKTLVTPALSTIGIIGPLKIITFIGMLVFCTFGVYIIFITSLLMYLKHCFRPLVWLFPLITIAIYLIMATCLAADEHHVGSREELLHRPFIWAYFVVLTWTVAGSYHLFFGNQLPSSLLLKAIFFITTICLLLVPLKFGHGISTIKEFGMNFQEVPLCQLKAANFIKNSGNKSEIIQDSSNDPRFLLSALSERSMFVIDAGGYRAPTDIQSRLKLVSSLRSLSDINQVKLIMKNNLITWYVGNPGSELKWGLAAKELKVFECDGYSIYKF
jgi:hypothetical protein